MTIIGLLRRLSINTGRLGKFLLGLRVLRRSYIEQFRVKAGELAEEADEAGWEPPRGQGATISNGLAGRGL